MKKLLFLVLSILVAASAYAQTPTLSTQMSDRVYCGGAYVPIKYAVIDDASSGDNTIIAAVASKKIRVLQYVIISASALTIRFESGASGTALTGQMSVAANGGISANCGAYGCFETAAGALLNIELSAGTSVDGHLTYVECT